MIASAKAGEAPAVKEDLAAVLILLFLCGTRESEVLCDDNGGT